MSNENIRAWVLQMLEQGRATCHPAGTHVVPEPMHSFEDRLNACRDIGELEVLPIVAGLIQVSLNGYRSNATQYCCAKWKCKIKGRKNE